MEPNPYESPRAPIERLEVAGDSRAEPDDAPPRKWYSLTLVEILVVIALIGIVLALAIPPVQSVPRRSSRTPTEEASPGAANDEQKSHP